MRRRKSPADQLWSTHRDHLPTNLYNNVAFLKYVWQDPLTSWFICKVVPAGGGGEGRGGRGEGEGRERGGRGEGSGGRREGEGRGAEGEGRGRGGERRERGGRGKGDVHCMFNMERV